MTEVFYKEDFLKEDLSVLRDVYKVPKATLKEQAKFIKAKEEELVKQITSTGKKVHHVITTGICKRRYKRVRAKLMKKAFKYNSISE